MNDCEWELIEKTSKEEPDVIAEIPIPVPKNRADLEKIGLKVIGSIETLELSMSEEDEADNVFCEMLKL